jgi:hypothetical protein
VYVRQSKIHEELVGAATWNVHEDQGIAPSDASYFFHFVHDQVHPPVTRLNEQQKHKQLMQLQQQRNQQQQQQQQQGSSSSGMACQ